MILKFPILKFGMDKIGKPKFMLRWSFFLPGTAVEFIEAELQRIVDKYIPDAKPIVVPTANLAGIEIVAISIIGIEVLYQFIKDYKTFRENIKLIIEDLENFVPQFVEHFQKHKRLFDGRELEDIDRDIQRQKCLSDDELKRNWNSSGEPSFFPAPSSRNIEPEFQRERKKAIPDHSHDRESYQHDLQA